LHFAVIEVYRDTSALSESAKRDMSALITNASANTINRATRRGGI